MGLELARLWKTKTHSTPETSVTSELCNFILVTSDRPTWMLTFNHFIMSIQTSGGAMT